MSEETEVSPVAPSDAPPVIRPRGVAFARVWTTNREPISPVDVIDALYARGFTPGVTNLEASLPALSEVGLADAHFAVSEGGWRFVSLSSSRGSGCAVTVRPADEHDLPDDYLARRAVHNPRLVYVLEAGGPSNSDRALTENIAESIMLLSSGLVEIGGLGVKGNRPALHNRSWIGKIKAL
ncbi:MAG: hypothetical protein H7Z41_00600 [Cytophagales bacterium]|nr:hypothetical protein [Armatimonadota bacterium]